METRQEIEQVKDEQRQKIVVKAVELFSRNGCKLVTMDQVSQAMHISKRTLYEHFGAKEELIEACFDLIYDAASKALACVATSGQSSLLMVLSSLEQINNHHRTNGRMIKDAHAYYPDIYNSFYNKMQALCLTHLSSYLNEAAKQNLLIDTVDMDYVKQALLNIFDWSHQLYPDDVDREGLLGRTILHALLRGILTVDAINSYASLSFDDALNTITPAREES